MAAPRSRAESKEEVREEESRSSKEVNEVLKCFPDTRAGGFSWVLSTCGVEVASMATACPLLGLASNTWYASA
jgi:hypothetical protein